ncbi:MAG TPA: hypothetical protein DDZ39_02030 [Flavobacteriaceae bacterium]|jgi:hypothetical protein|nr:hypothetical protein [Flavobacteriaceae bacterium]HBS12707.1 hypothetical protein [Flavobacteriaceae bacterium]
MSVTNKIPTVFETIAPYNQQQIEEALSFLIKSNQFKNGARYFYPNWSDTTIEEKLKACHSCADFQTAFVVPMLDNLIKNSITNLKIIGLEDICKKGNHLFVSNHRDIFIDAAMLQHWLYYNKYPYTEISLGDNLIVDELIERVAKLNNMYTVFRNGSKIELVKNAINLSAYLRYSIVEKKVSSWIAHSSGRAKDGNDKTSPGLVKMLLMSGRKNQKKALKDLNIVISSVSYEIEPCALEKAVELQTREKTGTYKRSKYENINSIVKGIEESKGDVCLHFEKLDVENIDFSGDEKSTINAIVTEMDRLVYKNYNLYKTNYMSYDLLYEVSEYSGFYNKEDLLTFSGYIQSQSENLDIQHRLLKIYANPVLNKKNRC